MGREEIDTVLRYGGNERDSRMRIAAEFMKEKSVEDHASFLQNLFNGGNCTWILFIIVLILLCNNNGVGCANDNNNNCGCGCGCN